MSEDPGETANRLKARMMYEGYTPTDRENEFLILMARRDAIMQEARDDDRRFVIVDEVRDESHNIKTPVGRIVTAGHIGTGGIMRHAILQMIAAGATYPVTMEMTQADASLSDVIDMGRLNHDVTLTLDMPPAMGKTMQKALMMRPAMAPESNRAERRAGRHNKPKQKLKGLR